MRYNNFIENGNYFDYLNCNMIEVLMFQYIFYICHSVFSLNKSIVWNSRVGVEWKSKKHKNVLFVPKSRYSIYIIYSTYTYILQSISISIVNCNSHYNIYVLYWSMNVVQTIWVGECRSGAKVWMLFRIFFLADDDVQRFENHFFAF